VSGSANIAMILGLLELSAQVAWLLEFVEELANAVGEGFGAAEVDGALPAILAVCEVVVGSVAGAGVMAVGGDDGSALSEEGLIRVDEVEGGGGHGCVSGAVVAFVDIYSCTLYIFARIF